ncbi:DUF6022 family protein [Deinococcus puniceus]|uniref:DUF6022 family protein n=1 Tax=Deinococcus puniceus TaxID=1182568 RepID=UPI0007C8C397|nr:DUF6022 family protein [Deinococcus puniceus]
MTPESPTQTALVIPMPADIHRLAAWADAHLEAHWQGVLTEYRDKLDTAYAKAGDMAYGTYQHLLFRPIKRALREAGFGTQPALPGDFGHSREWGNADETHQERWIWSVVTGPDGVPLGTLVHIVPHDHSGFRIPQRPSIFGLPQTELPHIEAALSKLSPDFAAAQSFDEWYAGYLAGQEQSAQEGVPGNAAESDL